MSTNPTANMESATGPRLLQQAEKMLLHPIHPHLISYCPTMDLIAIVTDEENLDVFRINGQRAFGLKRKSADVNVDYICWEFNGQAIAVAWSDGFTDILSAETGKVIYLGIAAPAIGLGAPKIQCIGWGLNFIDAESVRSGTGLGKLTKLFSDETATNWDSLEGDTTIEDFLQRQPDPQALDAAPDLPDQLAMMDMETLLPKLPAIPLPPATPFMRGPQADAGAFSSQAQVDALLHSHQLKDHRSVDMFIRCTDQGTVHPSIYDSFETVNIRLPAAWNLDSSRQILHTSHPYSCSHGLLTEVKIASQTKLAFVPLTLGFIPSAGIYLHLIASKASQLQNLLLYVHQCLQRIQTFYKHSQTLPKKFQANVSEVLAEKGQGDLVQNLYHLACIGHCPAPIKEWLCEDLQEAGHKRWDHAVVSSMTTILQLIHENLLPALDRCAMVLSRLRGLAQYHEPGWIFTSEVKEFTALLDRLKSLRLLAHTALLFTGDEKRNFQAFSKWLRYEIDFEATEPDSQSRQEMEARDPGVDIGVVLEYIQHGLTSSDLHPTFASKDELTDLQHAAPRRSYEETVTAVDNWKEWGGRDDAALNMEHVYLDFASGCSKIFHQISAWQESNISMDSGIVLEENVQLGGSATMDMRMVFEVSPLSHSPTPGLAPRQHPTTSPQPQDFQREATPASETRIAQLTLNETPHAYPDAISTYIVLGNTSAASQEDPQQQHLHIHKLTHTPTIDSLPKSLQAYSTTTLHLPPGASLLDAKFADDNALLLLVTLISSSTSASSDPNSISSTTVDDKISRILSIPYAAPDSLPAPPVSPATYPSLALPAGSALPAQMRTTLALSTDHIQRYTKHVFDSKFTPLRMSVNGRKGRRVVLVLGSDCKHYRVLDLDYGEKGSGEGGSDTEEDGGEEEEGDGDHMVVG